MNICANPQLRTSSLSFCNMYDMVWLKRKTLKYKKTIKGESSGRRKEEVGCKKQKVVFKRQKPDCEKPEMDYKTEKADNKRDRVKCKKGKSRELEAEQWERVQNNYL